MTRPTLTTTSWILGFLGLASAVFLMSLPAPAPFNITGLLLTSGLIGLLSLSPIPIGGRASVLAHSITIASGLYYGPKESILSLALGLAIGEIGHIFLERADSPRRHWIASTGTLADSFGQHGVSLALSFIAYFTLGGDVPLGLRTLSNPYPMLGLVVGFMLPFLATQWIRERGQPSSKMTKTDILTFILIIGFIPLPYAIISAAAAVMLSETVLVILGGGPAVVAPIVRGLLLAERDLQRRLDELSTLSEVSSAMRTSLNLDAILHTIYLQVAHVLDIRNFYISLYDSENNELSYPLAIKKGNREEWASRPISDRLTDRVILSGQPLLIANDAPAALRRMGMPELRNAPEAWLGVPLQTPSKVFGCIGVFHLEKPNEFSPADRDLLVTIAGQAAVAIENAMLYDQTRQRASALASLNEISTQMSSSLDPDQTLHLVAQSLIQVVGGEASAIYLQSGDHDRLELAQAIGLPDGYREKFGELSLDDPEVYESFHSGESHLTSKYDESSVNSSRIQMLNEAGYQVFVDVPLSTPSGPIGIATVFFSSQTSLHSEQLELLKTFVAQSAVAVANSRAHAATDQALQRQVDQLSRLESIGRDMVSTLDPENLFEIILTSALEATGSSIGYLCLAKHDAVQLILVAHHGFEPDNPEKIEEAIPAEQYGLAGKSFLEGQTILVEDVRRSPEHTDWTKSNTRSILSVPISRWGRALGVLTVESDELARFGQEETRFLSQVASYAAVAITNANLYQQLEDNLREQSLLYQASAQITTSMDVDSVALAVADSIVVSIGAHTAAVYRSNQANQDIEQLAVVTSKDNKHERIKSQLEETLGSILESITTGVPSHFEVQTRNGPFTAMAIPLQVGAQPVGAIEILFPAPHDFSEAEIRTSQTIASQAAVALQNTELFRRIRESRDRLDAILNSTKEGIAMVDQNGRILLVNRPFEQLLGTSKNQIIGTSILAPNSDLADKLQLDRSPDLQGSTLSAFEEEGSPISLRISNPQPRILERMIRPVSDTVGGKIGWLVVLRDVSEERELEETREQLVEMIVHDLRSPLTTIKGGISLLNKALPEEKRSEVTAQALNVSDRAVSQMLGLVNSLLDLARLESNPLEIKRQDVNLVDMLVHLSETFIPEANQSGLILNVELDEDLPLIRADEEKIRRVISNLLDNALKFTPEGGQIELSAKLEAGENVRITVADDGPGVPAEMREKIFDRFTQVPGVAGRRRGTGLGLAFAKLAIEAHDGQIWVEQNNGQGSKFLIELPP